MKIINLRRREIRNNNFRNTCVHIIGKSVCHLLCRRKVHCEKMRSVERNKNFFLALAVVQILINLVLMGFRFYLISIAKDKLVEKYGGELIEGTEVKLLISI